jgi:cytolysin-activating lysine-acyltransferase
MSKKGKILVKAAKGRVSAGETMELPGAPTGAGAVLFNNAGRDNALEPMGSDALVAAFDEIKSRPGPALGAARASGVSEGDKGAHDASAAPKTVAQVLGEIVWLMTQSPRHKSMPLSDLEWLVMPPILLKQFRIYYNGERPVGVVVWAFVDELVAARIDGGEKRLASAEWKCGSTKRIVGVVAPFGGEQEMIRALQSGIKA